MASGILTIVEQNDGKVSRIGWEALAAAQEIGVGLKQNINALVLGKNAQSAAKAVAEAQIQQAWFAENVELTNYTPDGYTAAARQVIEKVQPQYVFVGHSYQARDYLPKLATALGRGLISDCIGFRFEDDSVIFIRQMFQGKINADYSFSPSNGSPYFVSFQAGAVSSDKLAKGGNASVADAGINFSPNNPYFSSTGISGIRTKVLEIFEGVKGKVDLTKADIIVAVGRGIKEKDKLPVVEELAKVMDAEVAASRPVCDDGWLPMDRQIGSSGQTVAPKLYVAIGISGAIQHIVGMKGSRVIVAINKDERAPIFDIADYGVVGDLFEVVPALTAAIKEVKG
jgi:electron transfer flavoprotein alpha subunit